MPIKAFIKSSLYVAMLTAATFNAYAEVIIDTGPTSGIAYSIVNDPPEVFQSVAGRFDLANNYLITDVLGSFRASEQAAPLNIAIHKNNMGDPGEQIYNAWFTVKKLDEKAPDWPGHPGLPSTVVDNYTYTWQGLTGLSWILGPGTYWVVVNAEYDSSDLKSAAWGLSGAINPLDKYKIANTMSDGKWIDAGGKDEGYGPGLQIHGNILAVPEPSTYAMLGLGLGLLGFTVRRRK